MGINEIIMYIMMFFMLIAAVDRILSQFGGSARFLGKFGKSIEGSGGQFEEGFMAMGALGLAMVGMTALAPVLAHLLGPVIIPLYEMLGANPSMFAGTLLACDMGGFFLAKELAGGDVAAWLYSGLILGAMMGPTLVFSIPVALGIIEPSDRRYLALGVLAGIVTIPIGCIAGGLVAMYSGVEINGQPVEFTFALILMNMIPVLIVAVLVFLFVHMLPGDPARLIAGPEADAQVVAMVRQQLGLDQPLHVQFWHYITNVLRGDFGISMASRRPVASEIASRFMPTLWLTLASMSWAVLFGMAAGIAAAVWRNRWPDRLGMALAVSGISFPAFALGMLLMQVFSVELGWLPTVGADSWRHYILPSLTLGAAVAAVMARFTRASFVDVLHEDYMRTARAKGVSETRVVLKHGLRNAMIPVVTMMGLQFGFLLGGSIVVEKVFNWPGLGRLLVDSVEMRDYPVIQAEVLLFSLEFILINLVVDVLYAAINPAIRYK